MNSPHYHNKNKASIAFPSVCPDEQFHLAHERLVPTSDALGSNRRFHPEIDCFLQGDDLLVQFSEIPYGYDKYLTPLVQDTENRSSILIRRRYPLKGSNSPQRLDINPQEPTMREINSPELPTENPIECIRRFLEDTSAIDHQESIWADIRYQAIWGTIFWKLESLSQPVLSLYEVSANATPGGSDPTTITEFGAMTDPYFRRDGVQNPVLPLNLNPSDPLQTSFVDAQGLAGPSTLSVAANPQNNGDQSTLDYNAYMPLPGQPLICRFPGCTQGVLSRKDLLKRHIKATHTRQGGVDCNRCGHWFSRPDNYNKHRC